MKKRQNIDRCTENLASTVCVVFVEPASGTHIQNPKLCFYVQNKDVEFTSLQRRVVSDCQHLKGGIYKQWSIMHKHLHLDKHYKLDHKGCTVTMVIKHVLWHGHTHVNNIYSSDLHNIFRDALSPTISGV